MSEEEQNESPRSLGRNDRCHCDSGKKYKQCCLPKDEAEARAQRAAQAEAEAARSAEASEAAEGEAEGSEAEEQSEHRRRPHREQVHHPWKRGAQANPGAQKRTIPRKVGS